MIVTVLIYIDNQLFIKDVILFCFLDIYQDTFSFLVCEHRVGVCLQLCIPQNHKGLIHSPENFYIKMWDTSIYYTVSLQHPGLQTENLQRWNMHLVSARNQNLFYRCQAWVKLKLALCLLLLTILQLHHLPSLSPPQGSNSPCLLTQSQPLDSCYCTAPLHFSGHCTARFKMLPLFFVFAFVYSWCENWLCWLGTQAHFVGLRNKLDLRTCFQNETHSYVVDLTYRNLRRFTCLMVCINPVRD